MYACAQCARDIDRRRRRRRTSRIIIIIIIILRRSIMIEIFLTIVLEIEPSDGAILLNSIALHALNSNLKAGQAACMSPP